MLYKYLQREHAQLLLYEGVLRIGTLYEYRDIEKHGVVIGDDSEGIKITYFKQESGVWTHENQPEFSRDFFRVPKNHSIEVRGISLQTLYRSPNYYIYCTTEVFNKNTLADFGYDSCVAIKDPKYFFKVISKKLKSKAKFENIYRCQYQSREILHYEDSGIHPAIIKDPKYANQKEVRALWRPKIKRIKPLIIKCPELRKSCQMMRFA